MTTEEYRNLISNQERSKNKFNAKKTVVDGIVFDSEKEANRFCELKLLLRAGKIKSLVRQVKFELVSKSKTERAMYYKADFVYMENGKTVVEDVKGMRTQVYINKRKMFKQKYPNVEFRES